MTKRSLLLGLLMASWVNLWPAYSSLVVDSTRADFSQLSIGLLVPFFILLGLNALLELRSQALSPSELLTICCMGMIAACMQGEWLSGYFLGVITAPTYFASAENRWTEVLVSRLPEWSIVDAHATIGFYEGLGPGQSIPWASWITPLFWWGTFLGAILLANLSISLIFRKQWVEHERLPFPIARTLLELTGTSGTRGTLLTLMRSSLFWTGFTPVFGIVCWHVASWFVPTIPDLPLLREEGFERTIVIARGFPGFILTESLLTIIFGYFTKSDVLFSLWFFNLLTMMQAGIFNRLGFSIGGADMWCSSVASIGWQNFGGMIVFVGWGVWSARDHLREVAVKAFTGRGDLDDSEELFSYRTAAWMFIGSCVYTLLWLNQAGFDWIPMLTFWFGTLVVYLGLARIVVESGLVFLRGPITPQAFTWYIHGIAGLGPVSAAALGLTFAFHSDAKTFAMTTLAHIPRLGQAINLRTRRALAPAVMLAAFVGAISVFGFILYYGYHVTGSYNFGVRSFNGHNDGPVGIWTFTANRIQGQTLGTDWARVTFLGIGATFVGILLCIRYLFPRFPIHPIGFTFPASLVSRRIVLSVFLVWLLKVILLRIGGLQLYRRVTPLLLGLLVGFVVGIAFHVVVDTIWFHGNGHEIHRAW